MNKYTRLEIAGYEEVVRCDNREIGFTAWIAVHNSNRGPALGGCRVWAYEEDEAALTDVLRLSRGMTYKNALAKLPLGGGKSVVKTDLKSIDRIRLFEELGKFVETFNGRYITAEDVNSTLADMAAVKRQTNHVATVGASGNPSPFTAYGVYCAIKASALFKLGLDSLGDLTVAIQGVGETGSRLAKLLKADNCTIIATDVNQQNLDSLSREIEFDFVPPEDIYSTPCDIFAPCAFGSILNPQTIPKLQCQIVAGSANNQLLTEEDGVALFTRNILYAPDFVTNSGGVINISCEIGQTYDSKKARCLTANISDTLLDIFRLAKLQHQPTNSIANRLAEQLFDDDSINSALAI